MTKKLLKELMNLPLTDMGNALRLQAIFGKRWVYLPSFKCWMYWDGCRWKGQRAKDIHYEAEDAFRHLAQAIYDLPKAKEEWEEEYKTEVFFWLTLSQEPVRVKNAVKLYRDMELEEEMIREDVLRGN